MLRARGPISHFHGELHSRLATPLLSFAYALIGLAAILAGTFNRRGMGGRILAGALVIVVIQAAFMTLNGLVSHDSHYAVALYAAAIVPALAALALLARDEAHMRRWPQFWRVVMP